MSPVRSIIPFAAFLLLCAAHPPAAMAQATAPLVPGQSPLPRSARPVVPTEPPATATPADLLVDPQLNDVCFVDPERGWAVGDRGIILQTSDGGRRWTVQDSPTRASLQTVSFIDGKLGFAAGGVIQPGLFLTQGVLLRTTDGGQHWREVDKLALPGFHRVRFFDARRGWALCDPNRMAPTGVLTTDDGGRTWNPLSGPPSLPPLLADCDRTFAGLLLSGDNQWQVIDSTGLRPGSGSLEAPPGARPQCFTLAGGGWLAGERGLVLQRTSGQWLPPAELPAAAALFDFTTIALHGQHVWIAGTPGSLLFHSPDRGRTWQLQKAGLTGSIQALTFTDENHGWAVGSLGQILATRDGGETWIRQRQPRARPALLGLFGEPGQIPLELFFQSCGEDGWHAAVEIVGRTDLDPLFADRAPPAHRAAQALTQLGCAAIRGEGPFSFSAAPAGATAGLPQSPASATAGLPAVLPKPISLPTSPQQLEEYLVRRIRQWRPEIIVTDPRSAPPLPAAPLGLSQAVLHAVELAENPKAFPAHRDDAGLLPWSVKKVLALQSPGESSSLSLSGSQLALRRGTTPSAAAALARRLLVSDDETGPPPAAIGLAVLLDKTAGDRTRRDLFAGISPSEIGELRRPLPDPLPADLTSLRKLAQRQRTVELLLQQPPADLRALPAWSAQLDDLTADVEPETAGQLLYDLACRCRAAGRYDLSIHCLEQLVAKHPQHPLAPAAAVWLIGRLAASEFAPHGIAGSAPRAIPSNQILSAIDPLAVQDLHPAGAAKPSQPAPEPAPPAFTAPADPAACRRRAAELGRMLEKTQPAVFALPEVRFPLAAAARRDGDAQSAEAWLETFVARRGIDPWKSAAQAELFLAQKSPTLTRPAVRCPLSDKRPKLDGLLDDPCWQAAPQIELRSRAPSAAASDSTSSSAVAPSGVARIARDREYLYLAFTGRKLSGETYPPPVAPRKRDAQLSRSDRVEFLLDLDRDHLSFFRLAIDYRGFTTDDASGDPAWNPKWFVAATSDLETWTIEAAIPYAELAARPPQSTDAWALAIQRLAPNSPSQSWTHPPPAPHHPAPLGLLLFE